jgi:hypothetical protein
VTVAAIAIDDDGRGVVERLGIVRPVVFVDFAIDAGNVFVQGFCQEHVAGVLLVLGVAVTGLAGEEDDFFAGGEIGVVGEAGALGGVGGEDG